MRNPFSSPLWQNHAFVRVWSAASISIMDTRPPAKVMVDLERDQPVGA